MVCHIIKVSTLSRDLHTTDLCMRCFYVSMVRHSVKVNKLSHVWQFIDLDLHTTDAVVHLQNCMAVSSFHYLCDLEVTGGAGHEASMPGLSGGVLACFWLLQQLLQYSAAAQHRTVCEKFSEMRRLLKICPHETL